MATRKTTRIKIAVVLLLLGMLFVSLTLNNQNDNALCWRLAGFAWLFLVTGTLALFPPRFWQKQ